jgi:hypothetical protein
MRPHHARPRSAQISTDLEQRREAPTAKLAVDTTNGLIHRDREEQHHLGRYLFEVVKRLLCASISIWTPTGPSCPTKIPTDRHSAPI